MRLIGIYVTDTQIRVGRFNDADRRSSIKEFPVFTRALRKEDIPPALKNLIKSRNLQYDRVVLFIPRTWVSVRFLNLPAVEQPEIDKIIAYEKNSVFPLKPDELVFGHCVVSKGQDGYSKVMLAAVQKEKLIPVIAMLKAAGLSPDEIDVGSVSIFNQYIASANPQGNILLVHPDDGFADMLLIERGCLSFSRAAAYSTDAELEQELTLTVRALAEQGIRLDRASIVRDKQFCITGGLSSGSKGQRLSLDLIPQDLKERKIRDQRKRALVYFVTLIALNLAIIANIVFMRVKAQDTYARLLKSEMSKIESRAQSIQKKMRKAQILLEYSASGKVILGLLSDLYLSAPDGVVLSSIDMSGKSPKGVIIMVGQAPSSETVLKFANAMKTEGFIKKTDVSYITKRTGSSGQLVDFEIKAVF